MNSGETETERSEGFLNRWASRKQQLADEAAHALDADTPEPAAHLPQSPVTRFPDTVNASAEPTPPEATPIPDVSATPDIPADIPADAETPILRDEDMPAIESLTAKSDISDFFNEGVSATLRRTALRHIFALPVYNVRDGLNDYDSDYTTFEPLGNIVTSDMKWHEARKLRALEEAEAAEEAAENAARNTAMVASSEAEEPLAQDQHASEDAPAEEPVVKGDEMDDSNEDDESTHAMNSTVEADAEQESLKIDQGPDGYRQLGRDAAAENLA